MAEKNHWLVVALFQALSIALMYTFGALFFMMGWNLFMVPVLDAPRIGFVTALGPVLISIALRAKVK